MEDEKSFTWLFVFEKLGGKLLLVIEVYSAVYMATVVLVLESAVNNYSLLVHSIKFTVKNVNHCLFRDAWQIACLIARVEVR